MCKGLQRGDKVSDPNPNPDHHPFGPKMILFPLTFQVWLVNWGFWNCDCDWWARAAAQRPDGAPSLLLLSVRPAAPASCQLSAAGKREDSTSPHFSVVVQMAASNRDHGQTKTFSRLESLEVQTKTPSVSSQGGVFQSFPFTLCCLARHFEPFETTTLLHQLRKITINWKYRK